MSELKDRFEHVLSPEPPFETELSTALDAAVRGGRRRRARAIASKGLAVAACAVILGGAVVAIRPGGSPAPGVTVLGTASPAPVPSPELCSDLYRVEGLDIAKDNPAGMSKADSYLRAASAPVSVVSVPPEKAAQIEAAQRQKVDATALRITQLTVAAEPTPRVSDSAEPCWDGSMQGGNPMIRADVPAKILTALARAVAASVGTDSVSVPSPGYAIVRTDAGTYSVTVTVWAQRYDSQEWVDSCSPGKGDAKPCTVEWSSARDTARSLRFTDGSGRASLQYIADAGTDADGDPLAVWVDIDNYVEQGSGQKLVGPTWQELGFTRAGLRTAVTDTGAFS